jgi:hypothetical protein
MFVPDLVCRKLTGNGFRRRVRDGRQKAFRLRWWRYDPETGDPWLPMDGSKGDSSRDKERKYRKVGYTP